MDGDVLQWSELYDYNASNWWGAGLRYSINTKIGPLIDVSSSNISPRVNLYFSLDTSSNATRKIFEIITHLHLYKRGRARHDLFALYDIFFRAAYRTPQLPQYPCGRYRD